MVSVVGALDVAPGVFASDDSRVRSSLPGGIKKPTEQHSDAR